MLVSVIIPVYNVRAFVWRCAESLMQQTMRDGVEFVFVDDASTDGSADVLQTVLDRFPERSSQVRIIRHESNRGLPSARNTGLDAAAGKYILHFDGDDFAEPDMLEKMTAVAEADGADIVWSDWYLAFGRNERYMRQPSYATPREALSGILCGAMKYNVWNKLVRRSLYADNDIRFPDGYGMGEDMTMIRIFACAGKVAYIPEAFCHYVKQNADAFSNTYSERHLEELRHNADATIMYLQQKSGAVTGLELDFFKLNVKFPFLISGDKSRYRLWTEWYPEADARIMENRALSLRSRLLQWLASKGCFSAVKVYYLLVHRFVYGVIFR